MSLSLALFAKAPVPGQTKTRLQGALGQSGAVAAHCQLVEHALTEISRLKGMRTELWMSEQHPVAGLGLSVLLYPCACSRGLIWVPVCIMRCSSSYLAVPPLPSLWAAIVRP